MRTALVINPNTSPAMTAEIRQTAERVFCAPWTCRVVPAPGGPESLESWRDYQLAAVAVLPLLAQHPDVDGIVLACFGDPGLYMLKEVSPVPVVGIAEASISVALPLGAKFGILAGLSKAVALMDSMVATYGMNERYAGTVALDMHVLSFEADRPTTFRRLEQAGSELIGRGAEVLLLGCAGLTGFAGELSRRLRVAVVDPVEAGCRMLQLIVEMGLNASRAGLFQPPSPQRLNGAEEVFSKPMSDWLKGWMDKSWES